MIFLDKLVVYGGREATVGDLDYHMSRLTGLEDREKSRREIANCAEATVFLLNTWFVSYLGRPANREDIRYHMSKIVSLEDREIARMEIANCAEASSWLIRTWYREYLGWEANSSEIKHFKDKMVSLDDRKKVWEEITQSDEAQRRLIDEFCCLEPAEIPNQAVMERIAPHIVPLPPVPNQNDGWSCGLNSGTRLMRYYGFVRLYRYWLQ